MQLRSYPLVLFAVGLVGACFFGLHWFMLPKELTKANARMAIVEAKYIDSRRPQARFTLADGSFSQASCGRVRPLCTQLMAAPIKDVAVWLMPSALGEEPWVVAVESRGYTLLSETDQRIAFADFKAKPAYMMGLFLFLSLLGFFFARTVSRTAEQSTHSPS
jgi:hypothetical protein